MKIMKGAVVCMDCCRTETAQHDYIVCWREFGRIGALGAGEVALGS